MEFKKKVLGHVVRNVHHHWELLVFEHQDFPEAGIQIPGGTVEAYDHDLFRAVLREVREETGIEQVTVLTEILSEIYFHKVKNEFQKRHYFILLTNLKTDQWSHTVQSSGEDCGLQFNFYWVDLHSAPHLAGDQDVAVRHVIDFLENRSQLK